MANQCSTSIIVKCPTERHLRKLQKALRHKLKKANERGQGLYLGSTARPFFDLSLQRHDDSLLLEGWVKWCIEQDEMSALARYLESIAPVSCITLSYEEVGNFLYGRYTYRNGVLTDTFLTPSDFNDNTDGDPGRLRLLLDGKPSYRIAV